MFDSIRKRISHQINAMRRCFAQTESLPFSDVLSAETIQNIMDEEVGSYRDRIFSPPTYPICLLVSSTQFRSLLPKCSSKGDCGTSGAR
jgi:hypothetical protein